MLRYSYSAEDPTIIITDFGFKDVYGRACGFRAYIREIIVVDDAADKDGNASIGYYCPPKVDRPGSWFLMHGSPTRAGNDYGPAFNYDFFEDYIKALAYAQKRERDCRKRYEKKVRFIEPA